MTIYDFNFGELSEKNGGYLEITSKDGKSTLKIDNIVIKKNESFLDYIFGGCEVGLQIAIDFTLSNGKPNEPTSLHFWNP